MESFFKRSEADDGTLAGEILRYVLRAYENCGWFAFRLPRSAEIIRPAGGTGSSTNTLITAAGVIEFFGGALIALGLWAGYAGFITSGQMAVAYFMMHAPGGFWPIVNKGELAVLYCFVFLYIASRGSGSLSIEALIKSVVPNLSIRFSNICKIVFNKKKMHL